MKHYRYRAKSRVHAKIPIATQLAGDKLCTHRWFPRGGARCPTTGSAAVSTEFIGKCSWYFSHPTTRIEYNSRSSGCQMLQPVLFYKPPNDVAPGAGRRTHRVVWRPHSHAFALTNNSVTVHVSSQSRKQKSVSCSSQRLRPHPRRRRSCGPAARIARPAARWFRRRAT